MILYRFSIEYASGHWRVNRCWKVDARWADRVVDVDRRHSPKLRLRLLGTYPHPKGRIVNPRAILRYYWKAMCR